MEHLGAHQAIGILTALLMVASAVGIAVKWVRVPYSIALVVVGLLIGMCHLLPQVTMTPDLIFVVFLPPLLFEASWNINLIELRQNWRPIVCLATLGVIISMFISAWVMNYFGGIDLTWALLFGALISATDPISVLALFRRLGIDRRLSLILGAESLFNDGMAVILFKLILAMAITHVITPLPQTIIQFVVDVVGGILIGLLVGFVCSRVIKIFDDRLLETTLTVVVAYGSFLIAEQVGVSSVFAVLAAGIILGNYGSRTAMLPTTRLAVDSFWEYAAFVVNALVFLLMGMQIKLSLLLGYSKLILIGIAAILIARIIVVYGLMPFASTKQLPIPWQWRCLLAWGGLRGALSMAIALSLPLDFPGREELIVVTFGVVLFTLLVPGLTIEPLANIMRMIGQNPAPNEETVSERTNKG